MTKLKKNVVKKEKDVIAINDTTVGLGARDIAKLTVGQLPSGNLISIRAHIFRARKPGPVMLVLGGIHGDEVNGVEIVRQAITSKLFESLTLGSVIAIPLLNVYGFINFSRDVLDGKDVNRNFPGSAVGSMASRIAHTLYRDILPHVDFGIDFHTGGGGNYNFPHIRYTRGNEEAARLAEGFGAPITMAYAPVKKSLRKVAMDAHEAPILVFEGGENLRYDGLSISRGLAGIKRLLQTQGMLAGPIAPLSTQHFNRASWVRASRAGLFQWIKPSGHPISKGEPLGIINDPYGIRESKRVHAPRDGFIIGHNNTSVISQGDALFHIAYSVEEK